MEAAGSGAEGGACGPEPKFLQVATAIGGQIEQGRLTGRLPTERELCQRFAVSRVTLRRALSTLAGSGRVKASWGRGWYVVGPPISEPPNALLSFTELAQARGHTPGTKVLGLASRPATLDEADVLRVAPGARLLVLERLRLLDSVPLVLQRSQLALSRIEGLEQALSSVDLARLSLYSLLEERWGIVATRADYVVEARTAGHAEAELLDVTPGSPLLQATQLTFDAEGTPFERHWSSYAGNRYRFEASLSRPVYPRRPERDGKLAPGPLAVAGALVGQGRAQDDGTSRLNDDSGPRRNLWHR